MKHIRKVELDIDREYFEKIPAVQYDNNSRYLQITLMSGVGPLDITGHTVIVTGYKPDGTEIFNSCRVVDSKKGLIEVHLSEQVAAVQGMVDCNIQIYGDDKSLLSTQQFHIAVGKGFSNRAVESSNEFKGLVDALSSVQGVDNKFTQVRDALQLKSDKSEVAVMRNTLEQAVANVTNGSEGATNTEIVTARGGAISLNTRITDFEKGVHSFVADCTSKCVLNGFITLGGGHQNAGEGPNGEDTNWKSSDFIPVKKGDVVYYSALGHKDISSLAFYNADKKFIKGFSVGGTNAQPVPFTTKADVSSVSNLCAYVRISYSSKPYKPVAWIYNGISGIADEVLNINTFIKDNRILSDLSSKLDKVGYLKNDGTVSLGDKNWVVSDFVSVSGEYMNYEGIGTHNMACIILYDEQKSVVCRYGAPESSTGLMTMNFSLKLSELPDTVKYAKFSGASTTYGGFAPRVSMGTTIRGSIESIEKELFDVSEKFFQTTDLVAACTKLGFIQPDGSISGLDSDANWRHSDFLPVGGVSRIRFYALGHTNVASISYYDGTKKLLGVLKVENIPTGSGTIDTEVLMKDFPSGTQFYRVCYGVQLIPGRFIYAKKDFVEYVNKSVDNLNSVVFGSGSSGPVQLSYIVPPAVYTVCNDVVSEKKGHNRNYSASVYLDHLFDKRYTTEPHIRFLNGSDKVTMYAPIKVMDSIENNPTVKYNEGKTVLTTSIDLTVTGKDAVTTPLSTTMVSTLNSKTAGVTPKVVCIGDSITYGELATINDDNFQQNWAYHLMCKEFFMMDRIDNNNSGHECRFLGHWKKTRKMNYLGKEYDVVTFHEGIRGASLPQYLNGNHSHFASPTTGKFSLKSWVDRYRTLDDSGNRLSFGAGTGSLITAQNLADIDVCTPTHVVIMLSSNGGFNIADYRALVASIKQEYPNMIIGMVIPDTAGSYFPSLHPNCGQNTYMWTGGHALGHTANTHTQQYNCQKMLIEEFSGRESEGLYLVPFFFVQPTAEAGALRKVDSADSIFSLTSDNITTEQYGWVPNVHINAIGHRTWGYQLYSWLKYTIGKTITE